MAKKLTKKQRNEFEDLLEDFDLGPGYGDFIRKWVIFDWTPGEAVQRLVNQPQFRRQFPGLFEQGRLNEFLTGSATTRLSFDSLGRAIGRYGQMWTSYESAGKRFGYGKLGRRQLAVLIRAGVSVDEFANRAFAIRQAKNNPEALDAFNEALKLQGLKPLGKQDQLRFLAKAADQKFYDAYESAQLQSLGLGLTARENLQVAQQVNQPGPGGSRIIDRQALAQLVSEVKARQADIGPELANAGISGVELSKFVASGGASDPSLAFKLESLVAAKRSRGQHVQGLQPRLGPGGTTQYDESGAASYG